MSKTSEKNSALRKITGALKQFGAWVTDLQHRYWQDLFFRTEVRVIFLQMLFAATLSVLVAIALNYLYRDILGTIVSGINDVIKSKGTLTVDRVLRSVALIRDKNFLSFLLLAISISFLFSYIIAKVTLTPVRQTLRSQKRFIADIAHELRTPLAIIKTNSEVALLDSGIDEGLRKIFESDIEELDRTSGIINNLLSLSNLVSPEQIKFDTVELADVVDRSAKKLEKLAKSKQIHVTVSKTGPTAVYGNAAALDQIVVNLIKNALSYSPSGTTVSVTLEPDYRGSIVIAVSDMGIGIAPKDLRHIFEPFFRAETSRNRASGSSGLGLTIVSELVKLHKGKITVKSQLNKGSTFCVYIPIHGQDIPAMEDGRHIVRENEVSLSFSKGGRAGQKSAFP